MRRAPRPVDLRFWCLPALALVAALTGCARSIAIPSTSNVSRIAVPTFATTEGRASSGDDGELPKVVVRDYWRAPIANVIGWSEGEAWQGLRASLRRDGTLVRDHQLFISVHALPDWSTALHGDWYVYSQDTTEAPQVLQVNGMRFDAFNCQGTRGCSPSLFLSARMPDNLLRRSRDSVVVKVFGRRGDESRLTLHHDLINSYLAVVDSVSAARRHR